MKPVKKQRPGRLSAKDTAEIPDRLLDAATALFTARGFANSTMEAIAKQAGASSKTIYSRYANKEQVLSAVVQRLLQRAVGADGLTAGPHAALESPPDFLLRIGRELAALSEAREVAGLNRLIMSEAFRFPELSHLFIDLHDRATSVVRMPLEKWHNDGLLPDLPTPRLAAMLFVEMVASIPRVRALLGEPLSHRESSALVATAVSLFLRGCGYQKP
jgi:AcrR family transcriptional regulator